MFIVVLFYQIAKYIVNHTVTVFAKFLGISGLIPLSLLIFWTKIWRGINDNKQEKCSSLVTLRKINYFSGSFSSKSDKTIYFSSFFFAFSCIFFFSSSFLAFYYSYLSVFNLISFIVFFFSILTALTAFYLTW